MSEESWYGGGDEDKGGTTAYADGDKIWRYYIKPKTSGEVTFLDGFDDVTIHEIEDKDKKITKVKLKSPFVAREHQFNINGSWQNWCTCVNKYKDGEVDGNYFGYDCPPCFAKASAEIAVFTVIDHRRWEDKKKKVHVDEKKTFVIKKSLPIYDVVKRLQNKIKNGKLPGAEKAAGLRGCRFEVHRDGEKMSSNVGTALDFVGWTKLPDEPVYKPVNYMREFKPKSKFTMKKLAGQTGGSSGGDGGEKEQDSVPF